MLNFAKAWTEWEIEMFKDRETSMANPVMKQRHAALILEFCTIKRRAYVDGLLSYGMPPTYGDIKEEAIIFEENPSKSRTHIDVKCPRLIYRFVVLKKQDGWRIDSIKWKSNWTGHETENWQNGLIGL